MNERIQELLKQSRRQASEIQTPGSGAYENLVFEKFAELLIRECTNMLPEDSIRNADGEHMFYVIRERFGVEAFGR